MTQAAIFKSNQSQAVRLPKAVAFPDDVKKFPLSSSANPASLHQAKTCGTTGFPNCRK